MNSVTLLALTGSLMLAGCSQTSTTADTYNYACDSGIQIAATYPDTDTALVSYQGREHSMRIDASASGARYVDEQLEWWTKGPDGTLLQRNANGESRVLEQCSQLP